MFVPLGKGWTSLVVRTLELGWFVREKGSFFGVVGGAGFLPIAPIGGTGAIHMYLG